MHGGQCGAILSMKEINTHESETENEKAEAEPFEGMSLRLRPRDR